MAGFNADSDKKKERIPQVRKTVITYEEISDDDSSGYTFQFGGLSKTGKTINALALGYISKKNIPALKENGFKYIPYALENKYIPDIKKIIMIESENAIKKQYNRPMEREILGGPDGIPKPKIVRIPVTSKLSDIAEGKESLDEKSATEIQMSQTIYMAAIDDLAGYRDIDTGEWVKGKADENTLVIIDSASRLKLLLDVKAGIVTDLKLAQAKDKDGNVDTEISKKINSEKWIGRNNNWQRCMTQLRGLPGLTVATFMDQETTPWVLKMNANAADKGRAERMDAITRVEAPRTTFNFDMCYTFNRNPLDDTVFVTIDKSEGRYMYRGPNADKHNRFELNYDNKYTFLWVIEAMLRIQLHKQLGDTKVDEIDDEE